MKSSFLLMEQGSEILASDKPSSVKLRSIYIHTHYIYIYVYIYINEEHKSLENGAIRKPTQYYIALCFVGYFLPLMRLNFDG